MSESGGCLQFVFIQKTVLHLSQKSTMFGGPVSIFSHSVTETDVWLFITLYRLIKLPQPKPDPILIFIAITGEEVEW